MKEVRVLFAHNGSKIVIAGETVTVTKGTTPGVHKVIVGEEVVMTFLRDHSVYIIGPIESTRSAGVHEENRP